MTTRLDRPHEPGRHAVLLDQCRDWVLGDVEYFVVICTLLITLQYPS